jgi:predicted nucleic acid-binding protein
MAMAVERHQFHRSDERWWDNDESAAIGFCRLTQIGLLRLLTSAAAMTGHPLTNEQAWQVYEPKNGSCLAVPDPTSLAASGWEKRVLT